MSRSQPNDIIPNPSTTWFEWNGGKGNLRYFDKELKQQVEVGLPFQFILLDRLSTITGWHNKSEAAIFSNEVRDTRKETLLVKSFKLAEPIAEGFYSDIRDKVKANGGKFTVNAYIAFTDDSEQLSIGSLKMHGVAMSAWIELENDKELRNNLYTKAIRIASTVHGEKGTGQKKIEWEAPVFDLVDLPTEVNDSATELDRKLQEYLRSYFKRARSEQVATLNNGEVTEDRSDHSEQEEESNEPF